MILQLLISERRKLAAALARAGTNEIGGQLFGEQLAPSSFRITDVAVQARPGTVARFVVDLVDAGRAAAAFFRRTAHDYKRYNYLGEWHSHPSFAVEPSYTDRSTMRNIVNSRDFTGSFAVLMIVRLRDDQIEAGVWLFAPRVADYRIDLEISDVAG